MTGTLKPTGKQLKAIEEVLDAEHPSVSAAAKAVWDALAEVVLERAKFVLVAQLRGTRERPEIDPSDPEAIKVALGYYGTRGDATKGAESLVVQAQTGDRWRAWALPVVGETPAELSARRKAEITEAEKKVKDARGEKFLESIAKHRAQMEKRAQEYREGREDAAA